jgi:hypothetical protein
LSEETRRRRSGRGRQGGASAGKADAEKRALLKPLERPSGVSTEDRIKRALAIIERAVRNGRTEVEFIRSPIDACTDRGRAINQQERGWEGTLTGLPKEF